MYEQRARLRLPGRPTAHIVDVQERSVRGDTRARIGNSASVGLAARTLLVLALKISIVYLTGYYTIVHNFFK